MTRAQMKTLVAGALWFGFLFTFAAIGTREESTEEWTAYGVGMVVLCAIAAVGFGVRTRRFLRGPIEPQEGYRRWLAVINGPVAVAFLCAAATIAVTGDVSNMTVPGAVAFAALMAGQFLQQRRGYSGR
jgi:hypothetical protein